ncbi:hypothetical protein A3L14_05505 [Thermococcus thioreducens]|uniref:Uncharacterized protein n=1 Tax=Thermococcus thioreducens TaxID=277988 RepID=A0A2Z2MSU0_9EURY|nr:hypothetical protein [Thermococcus thioreducens]ASJ12381.1 hypothetical protein A3L14_05505 [Thermococcus thioreducens]
MKKLIIAILVGLGLVLTALSAALQIPITSMEYAGTKVEYYRGTFLGPSFEVELPTSDPATVTVSMLMPNGSMVDLGVYSGKGKISIDFRRVLYAMREWNRYLRAEGINPESVKPSLLLLGTTVDRDGNLNYFMKTVPLNIGRIVSGMRVKVQLNNSALSRLYSKSEVEKILHDSKRVIPREIVGASSDGSSLLGSSCSPPFYEDGDWTWYCFEWFHEKTLGRASIIPVAAFQVTGDTDKVNSIFISLNYDAISDNSAELAFSAVGAIEKGSVGGSGEGKILGYSYTIDSRSLRIPESTVKIWGSELTSPSVVGAGIGGSAVFSKYRLYRVDYVNGKVWNKKPLDTYAYVILGKPDEKDMSLRKFVEPGWPRNSGGPMSRTMWFVHWYWDTKGNIEGKGGILTNTYYFGHRVDTLPLFSASAPVLGIIGSGNTKVAPFTLAIGVGLTKETRTSSLVSVSLALKETYKDTNVRLTIYSSKVRLEYKGRKYPLTGMFGDIFIPGSLGYNPPCDPHKRYCPMENPENPTDH